MRIGLFFGSFNPIHIGHLIIANTIVEDAKADQVWFVVSPLNPFKSSNSLLHEFDRLKMVEAAIEDNFKLRASDVEFRMPKPSYTIETLTYISEKHPQHQFFLIIGADNLDQFTRWKNWEMILENHGLVVYPRPGAVTSPLLGNSNVNLIDAPLLDISATFIRKNIKENRSVKYLVPDKVLDMINSRKYYF
ncbi:MAG: nicotinate (nicotinamide) nucleotide adenylyltransferase [Bacteroidota bacterium]|nr:nicotinate (nicotinamide) nucleotide adenylyltransferase [Bacteroidota bacterium]